LRHMSAMVNNIDRHVDGCQQYPSSVGVKRERSLSKDSKPEPMDWPTPANRDAELDAALRELGEDLLEQEIPERLLRVLRSARGPDKRSEPKKR
jgi:hypothetical protein